MKKIHFAPHLLHMVTYRITFVNKRRLNLVTLFFDSLRVIHSLYYVYLTDFFRGEQVKHVRLQGLEHVIIVTAIESKVYIRNYR